MTNSKKSGGKALKVWNWVLVLAFVFFAVCLVWEFVASGSYTVTSDEPNVNDGFVAYSAECKANAYYPSITDLDNDKYFTSGHYDDRSSNPSQPHDLSEAQVSLCKSRAEGEAVKNYLDHVQTDYIVDAAALAVLAVLLIITAIIRRKK